MRRPQRRPAREVWMYVTDPPKLKRRRKTKHLTQGDLAIFARCTQQYISLLESGTDRDCSEEIALRICKALDIELEDYFEARSAVPMPDVATNNVDRSQRESVA